MLRVTVDDRRAQAMLSHVASRASNPRAAMKRIEVVAHRSVLRNFNDQGRPQRWKPLAESTRDARDRKTKRTSRGRKILKRSGGQYAILQDTGALKKSIHAAHGRYNVTVYTKHKSKGGYYYPAVHQHGSRDGKIPARPFMVWQDADIKVIRRIVLNHLINTGGKR